MSCYLYNFGKQNNSHTVWIKWLLKMYQYREELPLTVEPRSLLFDTIRTVQGVERHSGKGSHAQVPCYPSPLLIVAKNANASYQQRFCHCLIYHRTIVMGWSWTWEAFIIAAFSGKMTNNHWLEMHRNQYWDEKSALHC